MSSAQSPLRRLRIVALVTDEPANWHLCQMLAAAHELVAIVHPIVGARPSSSTEQHRLRQKRFADYGIGHAVLRKLTRPPFRLGWPLEARLAAAASEHFPGHAGREGAALLPPAGRAVDVNHPDFIAQLRRWAPDVVVSSGGPIYRAPLIEAAPLMINYHTGLSPFYNGAHTIPFAFANGHTHLCGGTLMVINTKIDGGAMLAHYVPAYDAGDDPADLFCKALRGGAALITDFLTHRAQELAWHVVPQPAPTFYFRSYDWTVAHAFAVQRRLRLHKSRPRPLVERRHVYWTAESAEAARARFEAFALDLFAKEPTGRVGR